MSRAFVKESDVDEAVVRVWPELPPGVPNWITPGGMRAFRARVDAQRGRLDALGVDGLSDALRREAEAELRHLEQRAATHVEVAAPSSPDRVAFGVRVRIDGEGGAREVVLVGVDEVGRDGVSWQGPLARALWGAEVGDVVTVETPRGSVDWEVVALSG